MSINYEVLNYATFTSLILLSPTQVQILYATSSQISLVYALPLLVLK
jgi:hypothetical protein